MKNSSMGTPKGLSIFHRLLFAFVASSLLLMSLMGAVYYFYTQRAMKNVVTDQISSSLQDVISLFEQGYDRIISSDLTLLESTPSLDNFLTAPQIEKNLVRFDIEKMFFRLASAHDDLYQNITFFDAYGNEKIIVKNKKRIKDYSAISKYPENSTVHQGIASLFHRLKESGPGSILFEGPWQDSTGKEILLAGISKRDPEIAGFGGVILLHCDLSQFIDFLASIKVFGIHPIWMFAQENRLFLAPPEHEISLDPRPYFKEIDRPTNGPVDFSQNSEPFRHLHENTVIAPFILSHTIRFGTANKDVFSIVFSIPEDIFSALKKSLLIRTLLVIALGLVIAIILSFTLARQFSKPIIELAKASRSLGLGDFQIHSSINTGGEIGELADSFALMARELDILIRARDMEIASRKKTEKALKKAHDKLEQRVEQRTSELKKTYAQLLHAEKLSAVGGLSASIAHEFNNPLQGVTTVIKGVKRRTTLGEEDAELVDMAIKECERMKALIKSLQEFNRPTSGKIAPIDVHSTINSLLILSKKEYINREITVETHYADNMPAIRVVADQIKQVLLNLLSNAADACERGGKITIYTEVNEENIVIRVQDNGTGIKPDYMDHIFEPFFTTKPTIRGTGLGLSISHGIVKWHRGKIDVESDLVNGTIFSITLPKKGFQNAEKVNPVG